LQQNSRMVGYSQLIADYLYFLLFASLTFDRRLLLEIEREMRVSAVIVCTNARVELSWNTRIRGDRSPVGSTHTGISRSDTMQHTFCRPDSLYSLPAMGRRSKHSRK